MIGRQTENPPGEPRGFLFHPAIFVRPEAGVRSGPENTIHDLLGYIDQVLPPIYGKGLFIDLLHFNYVVIGLVTGMVIRNRAVSVAATA